MKSEVGPSFDRWVGLFVVVASTFAKLLLRLALVDKSDGKPLLTMKNRIHIIYTGTVQGIGFRFAAERLAASLNLTGWVKNLSDGNVEVVAEGEEADLGSFIDKMKKTMEHYIRGTKIVWQEYSGEFNSFGIRFY